MHVFHVLLNWGMFLVLGFDLGFLVYFLLVVVRLVVITGAVICLERLVSKVTCYMSSGILNSYLCVLLCV